MSYNRNGELGMGDGWRPYYNLDAGKEAMALVKLFEGAIFTG